MLFCISRHIVSISLRSGSDIWHPDAFIAKYAKGIPAWNQKVQGKNFWQTWYCSSCFAKVLFSVCEGNIGLYCLGAACYSWSPSTWRQVSIAHLQKCTLDYHILVAANIFTSKTQISAFRRWIASHCMEDVTVASGSLAECWSQT